MQRVYEAGLAVLRACRKGVTVTTPSQHQHPRPPGQTVSPQVAGPYGGLPADVIELIMADHRRIRRFRAVLDDAVRGGSASGSAWVLAHVWDRLTGLLDTHTRAEEEICYLPMFGSGPSLGEWRQDAIADHDDIREAIAETLLQPPGSALWWRAARDALAAATDHLDREEDAMLAGWLPRLTTARRLELGRQWLAFVAAWREELAQASDPAVRASRKGRRRW